MGAAPAHLSATVVLLRPADEGVEVLLLRRNKALDFHGGDWVFPGGRVDEGELREGRDILHAAQVAAAREVEEEAGLAVDPDALVAFSRWVTPASFPKRFDTYFFAAEVADDVEVKIDGGEIHDHRWTSPADALSARSRGELGLPPPTFVTLSELHSASSVAEALARYHAAEIELFEPRIRPAEGGLVALYHGDAGYEVGEPSLGGARHRLSMLPSEWRYERSEGG